MYCRRSSIQAIAGTSDPSAFDLSSVRAEFPILARRTYLNSCSLGALSKRSERYLDEFQENWHDMGASAWYQHWLSRIEDLRVLVADFWGSSAAEVACLPSTSAALAMVGESVPTGSRNKVICTELDFPTLPYQWMVKPEIELVVLESPDGIRVDPEQFEAAVDERTLFVATSHVFFTTGYVQDISTLARIAHDAGAYCIIDGYQGAGQVPLKLTDTDVDFYTAGPLKWLCGGPGLAYLYVKSELITQLKPRITSWFATTQQFDFNPSGFEYRPDARRFEFGTPALPTVHTALGGQEILDAVGIDQIVNLNNELTNHLINKAHDSGFKIALPELEHRSAIIMIPHEDPISAVAYLAKEGVIVDHRPGFVRISPHFYNIKEEIDHCIEALASY